MNSGKNQCVVVYYRDGSGANGVLRNEQNTHFAREHKQWISIILSINGSRYRKQAGLDCRPMHIKRSYMSKRKVTSTTAGKTLLIILLIINDIQNINQIFVDGKFVNKAY